MTNATAAVDRFSGGKLFILSGVILGLLVPSAASASITQVLGSVSCATQPAGATEGQRWCGNSAGATVASFDGTPIDVAVGFPVASGSDNNYPVVGIYHGWGGSKITPSSATAQRWLTKGYAVFSISDRGWGSSCGGPSSPPNTVKPAPCERGYIHLMSRAYEVRDVQTLLGKLADEGVINPQAIGATGGSNGGGMSLQLGSLKDRVELPNHELIRWESPGGKPMRIAATAPEFPWTDFGQALQPNGSGLDYVANSPYSGVLGDHRFGIEKNNWNASLYNVGLFLGYYGPTGDPEANITEWHNFDTTGGPYDGQPLAIQQEQQLPYHSPYYTNLSEPPAPALMENGWNDDLFPVDETVRYYNKVRATYPNQAMKLFYFDLGHNPRSAQTLSTSDAAKFQTAQNGWFAYYLKGEGSEPSQIHGGVTAITSFCPQTAGGSGVEYDAPNWATLALGEIRLNSAAEQAIMAPGTAPATAFTSGTICTTQAAGDNASTATYKLGAAPASGFTIVGSPTVIGEFSTPAANDQVIARLYDVNVPGGGTQQLIGRQTYRPLKPGEGFTKQVFQLHPQAWNVASGHVIKLELLVQDSTYARSSSSPHTIQVKSLELRLPTSDAPGSAGGLVQTPQAKYLPTGYTLARNVPTTAPGVPHISSGTNPNTGVFTLAWEASAPAAGLTYTLQHKPVAGSWTNVATGLTSPEYAFTSGAPEQEGTWTYRVSASNEGAGSEFSGASAEIKVDRSAPVVVTEPASSIAQTSATLNATVNPKDQAVSDCHFEYGTTTSYGMSVACSSLPGSGESAVAVSASLSPGSLSQNTPYHFRIVATNVNGTNRGGDQTFTTQPSASPSHWYKSGVKITEGETVPILSWGVLTLSREPMVAAPTICESAGGGVVENPVGGGAGKGQTSNLAAWNCSNAECPAGKITVSGVEYEKEFTVTFESLPWANALTEEEVGKVRMENAGVQLSLGCVAQGLHNGSVNEKAAPGFVGGKEPYYLAAPTVCVTTPEARLTPLVVNGRSATVTSAVVFDKGAGSLSCASGASKAKATGKLKVMGYNGSELIGASLP